MWCNGKNRPIGYICTRRSHVHFMFRQVFRCPWSHYRTRICEDQRQESKCIWRCSSSCIIRKIRKRRRNDQICKHWENLAFDFVMFLVLLSHGSLLVSVHFIILLIHEYWSTSAYGLFSAAPQEESRWCGEGQRDALDGYNNGADDASCLFVYLCFISQFLQKSKIHLKETPDKNLGLYKLYNKIFKCTHIL